MLKNFEEFIAEAMSSRSYIRQYADILKEQGSVVVDIEDEGDEDAFLELCKDSHLEPHGGAKYKDPFSKRMKHIFYIEK